MFQSWIEIDAWPWHGGLKNKQAKWLPLFKLPTLRPRWFIHLAWNLAKIYERKSFFVFLSSSFPLFFLSFFLSFLLSFFLLRLLISLFFSFLFYQFESRGKRDMKRLEKILARVKFQPVPMNEPKSSLNGCRWLNRYKFAMLRLYLLKRVVITANQTHVF